MHSEDTKILESNHYHISDKTQFIIYADQKLMHVKVILKIHLQQKRSTYPIRFFNVYNIAIERQRK